MYRIDKKSVGTNAMCSTSENFEFKSRSQLKLFESNEACDWFKWLEAAPSQSWTTVKWIKASGTYYSFWSLLLVGLFLSQTRKQDERKQICNITCNANCHLFSQISINKCNNSIYYLDFKPSKQTRVHEEVKQTNTIIILSFQQTNIYDADQWNLHKNPGSGVGLGLR